MSEDRRGVSHSQSRITPRAGATVLDASNSAIKGVIDRDTAQNEGKSIFQHMGTVNVSDSLFCELSDSLLDLPMANSTSSPKPSRRRGTRTSQILSIEVPHSSAQNPRTADGVSGHATQEETTARLLSLKQNIPGFPDEEAVRISSSATYTEVKSSARSPDTALDGHISTRTVSTMPLAHMDAMSYGHSLFSDRSYTMGIHPSPSYAAGFHPLQRLPNVPASSPTMSSSVPWMPHPHASYPYMLPFDPSGSAYSGYIPIGVPGQGGTHYPRQYALPPGYLIPPIYPGGYQDPYVQSMTVVSSGAYPTVPLTSPTVQASAPPAGPAFRVAQSLQKQEQKPVASKGRGVGAKQSQKPVSRGGVRASVTEEIAHLLVSATASHREGVAAPPPATSTVGTKRTVRGEAAERPSSAKRARLDAEPVTPSPDACDPPVDPPTRSRRARVGGALRTHRRVAFGGHGTSRLWQPGMSRYLGVVQGAGQNSGYWYVTAQRGTGRRFSSRFDELEKAEAYLLEKFKVLGIDPKDKIRPGWQDPDANKERSEVDDVSNAGDEGENV